MTNQARLLLELIHSRSTPILHTENGIEKHMAICSIFLSLHKTLLLFTIEEKNWQ